MAGENDIVTFLMPNGTEVSNDPRFMSERERRAAEIEDLGPHDGKVGYTEEELIAGTLRGMQLAPLQSGQEGVGENAVPEGLPSDSIPGLTGRDVQEHRDVLMQADVAQDRGVDPTTETVSEEEVVDSNAEVLRTRQEAAERRQAVPIPGGNADDQNEEAPEPGVPVDDWTVPQLKREAKLLGIRLKGMKVGDLREAIKEKQAEAVGGQSPGV